MTADPIQTIRIAGRTFRVPRSRLVRRLIGSGLIAGGFLGFLPVLGFWMVPLGLAVLSIDSPRARRLRRRTDVWVLRRWRSWRS
ncbi:hypothetical protein [Methylobrevis albus]|uniref:Transmembrane protein (PGPGW) n=1 Tax=Methylobrevis albus TaxID=2793297 RepID=A0A931I461_9HYPH|nr:hypothetical protein [Methylobrevis albus]MBH0239134.1 hypothetical protein [Methylobrevis albus]